ncbi:ATP-binding cassette domain-containing protein [Actinokineospora sp. NBRC 105648]|uniref:ABC transporter ATP-binding protein n=1 Tax=Actinokineospora sp. NBRC 105648 TaxID=3032206 RepID=UPI0024A238FC|nr:ATP-binding cassette domain-containing protein [Actinokineospora sp. NBRC 105648]GLZ37278.1 ABC transporter ATP-binding protein [Actinokineospora sp. NBRC 105648]
MAEHLFDPFTDVTVDDTPAALYELRGAHVEYRTPTGAVPAVEDVSFDVPASGVTVLAGPSGSGKSTLLRVLGLIDRHTAGSVAWQGRDIGRLSHRARRAVRRSRIAVVFQSPPENLIGHLTVAGNLRAAAQSAGLTGADPGILDWLGIPGTGDWRIGALSGGQQQRLAFGCALARKPAVVLADEPTSQLDAASAALVLDVLTRLTEEGVAVVAASHDDELVARGDRVVRLREGRVERVEGVDR